MPSDENEIRTVVDPPYSAPAIAAVFAGFPEPERSRLLSLRRLIFDTALNTPEVGEVSESLKWGQPSYAAATGTPIRLGLPKSGGYAMFVHCQTSVLPDFRSAVPNGFRFDGNRGVLFETEDTPDKNALRMLIRSALTYKKAR